MRIAKHIARARQRVRICSPVITTAPVLAGSPSSCLRASWTSRAASTPPSSRRHLPVERERQRLVEAALLERVLEAPSPASPRRREEPEGTPHDFMHAKVTIADDAVFTGSFNLSRSGERNAEDVLEIHDAELADRLAAFVDEVRALYPPFSATSVDRGARRG